MRNVRATRRQRDKDSMIKLHPALVSKAANESVKATFASLARDCASITDSVTEKIEAVSSVSSTFDALQAALSFQGLVTRILCCSLLSHGPTARGKAHGENFYRLLDAFDKATAS